MYLENNGHSAKVTFDPASCEDIPKLIQGNLPGKFFPLVVSQTGQWLPS